MDGTPEAGSSGRVNARQRLGLVIHAAIVAALVPAYLVLAPPSRWDDPVLLVALVVLGVVAIRTEVPLPAGITFEALSALALIATALAGPLPALIVTLVPILFNAATGRERLLRAGNLANLAAYGGYALAGAAVLHAAAPDPAAPAAFGWLLIVGLMQLVLNWALGPALYLTFWLGHRPQTAVNVLADGVPTGAVMALLGAGTVLLTPALGVLALTLFAAVAILPQSFLTYAARTRPVARLDRDTAARRYAYALAVQLGLPRAGRRHLAAVAAAARRNPASGDAIDYVRATLRDRSAANFEAQVLTEWWNGRGGPIGLHAEGIPLAVRVLAVAQTWSELTASGTPELGHHDALAQLQTAAGARLDPAVVRAAHAVVAQERVTATQPAPEPRLHRFRVPAPVRRALAAP
jgi:hypothetical protein